MLIPEQSLIHAEALSDGDFITTAALGVTDGSLTSTNSRGISTPEDVPRQLASDCWLTPAARATLLGTIPVATADSANALSGLEYDARP
jgi:hypothetical protein